MRKRSSTSKAYSLLLITFFGLLILASGSQSIAAPSTSSSITVVPRAVLTNIPASPADPAEPLNISVSGADVNYYRYKIDLGPYSADIPIATPITDLIPTPGTHTVYVLGGTGAPLNLWQIDPTLGSWTIPGGGGGSRNTYTAECGNTIIDAGEGCDDGNLLSGDGCNAGCLIETVLPAPGNPSNCTGIPSVNTLQWNWSMSDTNNVTGYEVSANNSAVTTSPSAATLSATESNLLPNTTYQNRTVYALGGTQKSNGALCPNVTTLLQDPLAGPAVTPDLNSAFLEIPAGFSIPNAGTGQTGVLFELLQEQTIIQSSGWISSTSINFFGLSSDQNFNARFKLRNSEGIETLWSPSVPFATDLLQGDLQLTQSLLISSGNSVEPEEIFTLELLYENSSNAVMSQLRITDILDSNLEFINGSFEFSDPLLTASYDSATHTVSANRSSISQGESGSLKFNVRVSPASAVITIYNTAEAHYLMGGTEFAATSNTVPIAITTSHLNFYLFEDINANGSFEVGEPILQAPQATLTLTGKNGLIGTYNLANGSILLTGLLSGDYTFTVDSIPGTHLLSASNSSSITINKNSIHVVDLATVPQDNPTITLNVKAKPERRIGITNNAFVASLKFFDPPSRTFLLSRPITIDPEGNGTLITNQLPAGTYHIGLKGDQHLGRFIKDIAFEQNAPALFLDYSFGDTVKIIAGDLKSDDRINALDLSSMLIHYSEKGQDIPADLNRDSAVNASDMALLLINYLKQGEPTP